MDKRLKLLINTYELDPGTLPLNHQSNDRETFAPQPLPKSTNCMFDSHKSNSTNNSCKYVPPHRARSRKPGNKRNGTKNDAKMTEDEKMAKRRERFSVKKNDNNKQSHIYGLLSRGEDTRLKESETLREEYFLVILHQFITYTSTNTSKTLSEAFKKIKDSDPKDIESAQSLKPDKEIETKAVTMESLSMSLRKLRESLLHLSPSPFHKKVFLFSTRISYCCGQYQTYIPSINYLLSHKDDLVLSKSEVEEVAVILALHLTHFNNDMPQAIQAYFRYIPNRKDILQIIQAWIQKDYYTWIRIYNSVESFAVKSMMKLGLPKMINQMIKSLSSSYFSMKKSVIQSELLPDDLEYDDLVTVYKVNWTVDDAGLVTIRKRQSRKGR
ncbi:hypothetical protein CANMA_000668 [Candida margitis]|uniref:uncharacterized protein n=1 Tax=Candida margitis TaxID=1775924 RepID=UPI002226ACE2|nr:uncharacterized protein CANMA_000668 [Candida margitis]KAI5970315.1 hypothetical protein CANMA_000668 [Candida margitis]